MRRWSSNANVLQPWVPKQCWTTTHVISDHWLNCVGMRAVVIQQYLETQHLENIALTLEMFPFVLYLSKAN